MTNKRELCDKRYSLRDRLRLFNAIVTPTVLFGSGSWALTQNQEKYLRTTQRKMMRMMLGMGRRMREDASDDESPLDSGSESPSGEDELLESWVQWIVRTTGVAEEALKKAKVDDWITAYRVRKWRLAGHTARRDDNRWSNLLLSWLPVGTRKQAHPVTRWRDDIEVFWARQRQEMNLEVGEWVLYAQCRTSWEELAYEFARQTRQ